MKSDPSTAARRSQTDKIHAEEKRKPCSGVRRVGTTAASVFEKTAGTCRTVQRKTTSYRRSEKRTQTAGMSAVENKISEHDCTTNKFHDILYRALESRVQDHPRSKPELLCSTSYKTVKYRTDLWKRCWRQTKPIIPQKATPFPSSTLPAGSLIKP